MSELLTCGICGRQYPADQMTEFDEVPLCIECFANETILCSRCGTRLWSDDNAGDEYTHLCQTCYDRFYTTCTQCHRTIHLDDAYYESDDDYDAYCSSCFERRREDLCIQSYYYKPEPRFLGDGRRFYGVELEIDNGGEDHRKAKKLLEIANVDDVERLYIKHDGSLNDGMELVSHPATLDYHLKSLPWSDILEKAKSMGYKSHQSGTCGLHVHVNRTAFGETEAEQDEVIARILYFFEKHWEELLKFSRRTPKQLRQWANRYGLKEHPQDILKHAKGDQERYTCVNLTNYHTIEFRMFRGTLTLNSFLATLQLVERIVDVALCFTDEEIKNLSWTSFVFGCSHMPELVQYLKERRLFVNDPVEAESEV